MSVVADTGDPARTGTLLPEVRDLAADLILHASEISQSLTDYLVAEIPELQTGDHELVTETLASSHANIDQVLRLLRAGVGVDAVTVPVEAAEFVRGLVRRGIELPTLLRSYRLGHGWFWRRVAALLGERVADPERRAAALEQCSNFLFAYIDRMSGVLVAAYGTERDRVVRSAEQVRMETVRVLLAGDAIDEEVASKRLGYELHRHHLAVRVSSGSSEIRGVERAVTEAVAATGVSAPLVVSTGIATYDVWIGSYESFDDGMMARLTTYAPPEGVQVAVGRPGHGTDGFRQTHTGAVRTARVLALGGHRVGPVATYADLAVVTLLSDDLPRAREFVLARLGPLASTAEPVERLRETALAFLLSGGSGPTVARDLFVHPNTVNYRIKRAEELLGCRLTDDLLGITAALRLAEILGPQVLRTEDDG